MKKLVLGLGSIAAVAAPVAAVVACGGLQPYHKGKSITFERRNPGVKSEAIFDATIKVGSKVISGNDIATGIVKTIAAPGAPSTGKLDVSVLLNDIAGPSATTGELSYSLPTNGTSIVGYSWNFAKTVVAKIITEVNKVPELVGKVTPIAFPSTPTVLIGTSMNGIPVTNGVIELEQGTRHTREELKKLFIISDEDRKSQGFVISYSGKLAQDHAYLSMLPVGEYHLDMAANNLGGSSGIKRLTVKIVPSTKTPVAHADAQAEVKAMIASLTKDTMPLNGNKPSDVDANLIFWRLKIDALKASMSTEALALFKESDVTVVADDTADTVTITVSSQGETKSFTYDHYTIA